MSECTSSAGNFNSHSGAPVQYIVHRQMQQVQGYTQSHWTLLSGAYLLHIAPAATRVTGKQTTMKKYTFFAGRFDGHDAVLVCCHMHCSMEQVQGFTRSPWTLPLGKY